MGLWKPTRPSRTNTPKRYPFHYKGLGCKSRKSRDTWSNRQIWAWSAECSNCRRIALISYASKVMLKILQARIQQYANCDFQMFKLELEKAEEPEIKMPTSAGSSKKKKSSRKISALLTTQKSLCGSQQTVENSERDENTRPPDLPPEKSACRSRSKS